MRISVTERGTFRRCKRLWALTSASMQSLGTIVPRTNLALGKSVHAALAQWLIEPDASLPELFLHASAQDLGKIKAAYKSQVGADIGDDELAPYHESLQLGVSMMGNYQTKWGSPLFDGFTIVQAEVQLEIPIPTTDHMLEARLDGIVRRDATGDLYILEHKTYDARPRAEILQMNDQFLAYIWCAERLNIGKIMGIAYDGMWSRATPPRGSMFDDLFLRLIISRPRFEIDMFTEQLIYEANDMAALKEMYYDPTNNDRDRLAIPYPNRPWMGCTDDKMFDPLCTAMSVGDDYRHLLRTRYTKVTPDKEIDV